MKGREEGEKGAEQTIIRCGFVNIRNFTSEQKQKNILEYMTRQRIDIFGIIELGLENESFKKIKRKFQCTKDWKFEATSHRKQRINRGVGVIMRREVACHIIKEVKVEGFFVGWALAFKKKQLWIGFIYNPTTSSNVSKEEKIKLEETIKNFIIQARRKGGDMNFNHNQEGRSIGIKKILEESDLLDMWKDKCPKKIGNTFFYENKDGDRTGSRIDSFWGDTEIRKSIKTLRLIEKESIGDITDHLGLELTLELKDGRMKEIKKWEEIEYGILKKGLMEATEREWEKFRKDNRWNELGNISKEKNNIDRRWQRIEETIKNIAKENLLTKEGTRKEQKKTIFLTEREKKIRILCSKMPGYQGADQMRDSKRNWK